MMAESSVPQPSDYRTDDCANRGRMRVELNGVCEKCGFNNVPAPVAQVDAGKCASIDRTKGYSIPADSHHSCDFWQGFALALASVNRSFDQPTIVKSVMNGFGATDRLLKQANVDSYDLKEIRKCMK